MNAVKYGIAFLLFIVVTAQRNPDSASMQMDNKGFVYHQFKPGELWYDDQGKLINAHGPGIIFSQNKYYWFGEKRGERTSGGVNVYSSSDLYNWKQEGLALSPDDADTASDIARGCVMERPKVVFNRKTGQYIMWFHLELRGQGYRAARAAVAVSDKITGPYKFVASFRPNGNMSRDMTIYQDDDGSAYIIYASRDNFDMRIAKLADDFLAVTADDKLLFSDHREAPAIFKYHRQYYLMTSACTGWKPNEINYYTSTSLWGPWKKSDNNPLKGPGAETTFGGQSTYVLPVRGKKDCFIFLADRWNPANLTDSRYLWLPVQLKDDKPEIEWTDAWSLDFFDRHK